MAPLFFLKLPLLAQKVVINEIDLVAAIELSMFSNKFRRVLQLIKITVERIEYDFMPENLQITIGFSPARLTIKPTFTQSDTTNTWNIGGSNLDIIKEINNYSFSVFTWVTVKCKEDTNESKMENFEKITAYLLQFLKIKNFDMRIETKLDVLNLFIWKYTTRFNHIALQYRVFYSVKVTPDEIKLLLETLTIDSIYLNVQIRNYPHFKYFSEGHRPSKIRKMEIIEPDWWLEYDSLLNMAQESIECRISTGFSEKANAILKKWISGQNEKLEELELSTRYEISNQENILLGIKAIPSVFELSVIRERAFFCKSSIIKDIQREHDGCQATVIISDKDMKMIVWNEKHLKAIGRM